MSEFTAGTLRELRLRAGLTQTELGRRSGVHAITICQIEKGRVKPRELTWRSLLKALSVDPADKEQPSEGKEPASGFFGEVLGRDEFLRRLKSKMSVSLGVLFNQIFIVKLIEAADFFSRSRYYPGDFATAMELLGALLKTRKDPPILRKSGSGKYRRRGRPARDNKDG